MNYKSKYDAYWFRKLDDIAKAIQRAYISGKAVLDISGIAGYGKRKPESWYGRFIVCGNTVLRESIAAHLRSLARILTSSGVLESYSCCFSFRVTTNLLLEIERIDYREYMYNTIATPNKSLRHSIFRRRPLGKECICDQLFQGFLWSELSSLKSSRLPGKPGVYVVRVIERDVECLKERLKLLEELILETGWRELIGYVKPRLERVLKIGDCPVVYIGSSGNLQSRLQDLAGKCHTAFYSILVLLVSKWRLDYGFKTLPSKKEAERLEEELKRRYIACHGRLPALVVK